MFGGRIMDMSYNDILRENLASFIERSFYTVDPSAKYMDNWHIDLIADRLEQASKSKLSMFHQGV